MLTNDISFDDLAAHLVGTGDDCRFRNRRMLLEGALDLERANAVARAVDHIVGAAHKPEVAVLVFVGTVAGDIPVAANAGRAGIGITPILPEHPGWALRLHTHCDIALFVRRQLNAFVIDHSHLEAWKWLAHRTRLHLYRWKITAEQHGLGLAIAITDGHARFLFPHLDHFGVKRLTGSDAIAQCFGRVGFHISHWLVKHEHAVDGGRGAERGNGILVEHVQGFNGIKFAASILDEHSGSHNPGAEEIAP